MEEQFLQKLLEGGVVVGFATFVVIMVFRLLSKRMQTQSSGTSDESKSVMTSLSEMMHEHAAQMREITISLVTLNGKVDSAKDDMKGWTTEARENFRRIEKGVNRIETKVGGDT